MLGDTWKRTGGFKILMDNDQMRAKGQSICGIHKRRT